jgi:hypothetical protein
MAEVRFEKCWGEIEITPQMIHARQSILEAFGGVPAVSFASCFWPRRRLSFRHDGLANCGRDLASVLAKTDRVLPMVDTFPADAIGGTR